jgi:hypothetical protein
MNSRRGYIAAVEARSVHHQLLAQAKVHVNLSQIYSVHADAISTVT